MSELPQWKQNVEFMAELIEREGLGVHEPCNEPLEDMMVQETEAMAYGYALERYQASHRNQRLYGDKPLPVEQEIGQRFVLSPVTVLALANRALRDVRDLDKI